jgi:hypothetical protein
MYTFPRLACALTGLALAAPGLRAQEELPWSVTGYFQQSWPKQTETNDQIKQQINAPLGTHFKTWDEVTTLNLGVLALRTLTPTWKLGIEADWSAGQISGTEPVADFGFGPGSVAFKQRYCTYADFQCMAQYRPLGGAGRWSPFVSAAVGLAYEKDFTTLGFQSALDGSNTLLLRVDNHGFFPLLNCGIGVDYFLSPARTWYLEGEAGYSWCRLKHQAQAVGAMAPGPTVTADTDDTGPNLLLGIGRRF